MKIILAVDGSRYSDWAVDLLLKLPLAEPPNVIVLNVVVLDPLTLHLIAPPLTRAYTKDLKKSVDRSIAEAERYSARVAARLKKRWKGVRSRVEKGAVANTIVRQAEEERADLVVLGARGLGEVAELLLGSTSQKVAAYAPCSVLIVKTPPRGLNNVLVPVDGSKYSRAVVKKLATYFEPESIDPTVLFVWEHPLRPPKDSVTAMKRDYEALITRAGFKGEARVAFGAASKKIVEAAGRGVGLVVVGSRGLTGVKRFWGSVSRKVTMYSPVSVLVVRS